jgi:hypothetical protein
MYARPALAHLELQINFCLLCRTAAACHLTGGATFLVTARRQPCGRWLSGMLFCKAATGPRQACGGADSGARVASRSNTLSPVEDGQAIAEVREHARASCLFTLAASGAFHSVLVLGLLLLVLPAHALLG